MGSFTKDGIRFVIVLSVSTISLALRVNNINSKLHIDILFNLCIVTFIWLLFTLVCAVLIMHFILWQNKDVIKQSEYHMDDGNVHLEKWLCPCTFPTIMSSYHNYNIRRSRYELSSTWNVVYWSISTGVSYFDAPWPHFNHHPTHSLNVQNQGAFHCNFTTLEN